MKLALTAASTSVICHVFIGDSTSTTGAGKTALIHSDITAYYVRAGGTLTVLTMETISTLGTWASTGDNKLGFKLLHDTNAPGLYELDLPNNILAAGTTSVVIQLRATGAVPVQLEIQLATVPANATHVMGTALTEGAAGRLAGGIVKFFNINAPAATMDHLVLLDTVTTASTASAVTGITASDIGNIKTQTDKLAFTVTNQVDANVLDWKSATAPAMTGDAYARLGSTGSGLTSLAPSATALSTAVWTPTKAGYIDAAISSVSGGGGGVAGSGADEVTLTITVDGDAMADMQVWVTSDAEGASVVAGTLVTDTAGQVMFLLDNGNTYYLWAQKNGVNPIRGTSFVAVAD